MGICLEKCGKTGHYSPRRMEEADGIRNTGSNHQVYRKVNNLQTERMFGSKTVAQPWPYIGSMGGDDIDEADDNNQDKLEAEEAATDLLIDIKDLVHFQNEDHPPPFADMCLTPEQRQRLTEYLSGLSRVDDFSFLYQYYTPGLPPGPDSMHAKHIQYYLTHERNQKSALKEIIAVTLYLRCRQMNKLIRALMKIESAYNMGLSPIAISNVAHNVFAAWDEHYWTYSSTREARALACYRAIFRATRHLSFPEGISIWTLFRVLYPEDEVPPCRRVEGVGNLQCKWSYRLEGRDGFPKEVATKIKKRRERFAGIHAERQQFIAENKPTDFELKQFDESIVSDLFRCDMDESTLSMSIPKPGIGVNYFSLAFNIISRRERERLLSKPAEKENKRQPRSEIPDLHDDSQCSGISRPLQGPMSADNYQPDDDAASQHALPSLQEFHEIKDRAEKQKRWKRRFDGHRCNQELPMDEEEIESTSIEATSTESTSKEATATESISKEAASTESTSKEATSTESTSKEASSTTVEQDHSV
ncbi:uncharacterized protein [Amphiura filiformis]|uniref:uncharacterized protein n=1 Tax=Amphiura filiformis TaxID=82378 RepID=UPI003B217C32